MKNGTIPQKITITQSLAYAGKDSIERAVEEVSLMVQTLLPVLERMDSAKASPSIDGLNRKVCLNLSLEFDL